MDSNIIIAAGFAFAIPLAGIIGTWAVMKYRLNNHSNQIGILFNEKAEKEVVEEQFNSVNKTLIEIQKDVRTLLGRKR